MYVRFKRNSFNVTNDILKLLKNRVTTHTRHVLRTHMRHFDGKENIDQTRKFAKTSNYPENFMGNWDMGDFVHFWRSYGFSFHIPIDIEL